MEDELLGVRGQLMKAEATQGHAGSKLGVLEARVEELEQENSKAVRLARLVANGCGCDDESVAPASCRVPVTHLVSWADRRE